MKSMSCPRCESDLNHFEIRKLQLDRCVQCNGIWFDQGELQNLLKADNRLLGPEKTIAELRRNIRELPPDGGLGGRAYINCPVCGKLMLRKRFSPHTRLVFDHCNAHGVWLDGDEFSPLIEFARAGGMLLEEKLNQPSGPALPTSALWGYKAAMVIGSVLKEHTWYRGSF